MNPSTGQLALLGISVALFAIGGAISLARLWSAAPALRLAAKACDYSGVLAAGGVIVWHSLARHHWQPMYDNFDSLIWLAILLALFCGFFLHIGASGLLPESHRAYPRPATTVATLLGAGFLYAVTALAR